MKGLNHYRYALGICVYAAILMGCGGSQSAFAPSAVQYAGQPPFARGSATGYKVLFSFVSGGGANPVAGVTALNRILYGTTVHGGAYGLGTVFSITTSGQERVLHSFKGTYGRYPSAGLTQLNGIFYGTTTKNRRGTIFSVTTGGKERLVYAFKGASDGDFPDVNLTALNGTLYGTTFFGGDPGCDLGCGTVFGVTTAGEERVLYRFKGGPDGENPDSDLIALNGILYGTTLFGGTGASGNGTVFSITTAGKKRVVYSFNGGPDGTMPEAGLTYLNGKLYGTTHFGGSGCSPVGCGTLFSITTAGKERVVYTFKGAPDSANPDADLIALKGSLYGTTSSGGAGCGSGGCGTVFSVTTAGKERVLHSFNDDPDGSNPQAPLTALYGTLYGTTVHGGTHHVGMVFALKP